MPRIFILRCVVFFNSGKALNKLKKTVYEEKFILPQKPSSIGNTELHISTIREGELAMKTSVVKFYRALIVIAAVIALTVSFIWVGCNKESQDVVSPAPLASQQTGALSKAAQFQRVMEIQNQHTDRLMGIPGVLGVGIGLDGNQAVFHVFLNPRAGRPESVPAAIEGVRVKIIETDEFRAFDSGANHQKAYTPPVPGGISTSNDQGCFAGTRGFLAYKGTTVGYITNSHVAAAGGLALCPGTAPSGTNEIQPGEYDNGCSANTTVIGTLDSFVPLVRGAYNKVDAAFVASSTSLISANILDIGTPTSSPVDPTLKMTVKKSGRTTGLTTGTISTINATVLVSYGSGCGTYKFVNQFVVTPGTFSAAGDSGSPVVDANSNPVGLLFAGSSTSTICNPITAVLTALKLTF